jgi:hypothetical protein
LRLKRKPAAAPVEVDKSRVSRYLEEVVADRNNPPPRPKGGRPKSPPKSKGEKPASKLQPERRKNTSEDAARAACLILDMALPPSAGGRCSASATRSA